MNKDKIIKDLKERNDKLANQRRQFEIRLINEQYLVEKKDKEIERLKKERDKKQEVINKLEEWLINRIEKVWDDNNYLTDVLDKLKELKGSSK